MIEREYKLLTDISVEHLESVCTSKARMHQYYIINDDIKKQSLRIRLMENYVKVGSEWYEDRHQYFVTAKKNNSEGEVEEIDMEITDEQHASISCLPNFGYSKIRYYLDGFEIDVWGKEVHSLEQDLIIAEYENDVLPPLNDVIQAFLLKCPSSCVDVTDSYYAKNVNMTRLGVAECQNKLMEYFTAK